MTRSQQAKMEIKDFIEQKFSFVAELHRYYMVRELMNGLDPKIWDEIDANENVKAIPSIIETSGEFNYGYTLIIELIKDNSTN